MNTFTLNQKLIEKSFSEFTCDIAGIVTKLGDNQITVSIEGLSRTCDIHTDSNGNEYCFPLGNGSMATTFKA